MAENRIRIGDRPGKVTVIQRGGVAAVHPVDRVNVPHVDTVRHVVSGPAGKDGRDGLDGAGAVLTFTAGDTIPAFHVVAVRPDGFAYRASSLTTADSDRIVGIATGSALSGEQVSVRDSGFLDVPGPFPVGDLFCGPTGALSSSARTGALSVQVAQALTPTRLVVRIGPAITLTQ